MNGSAGLLQTVNYPSYYPINTQCTWKLVAPIGKKIMLTFSDLDIEYCSNCACASLEVYDGQDSTSIRLATYCGSSSNGGIFSTGRYMFLKFSTDLTAHRSKGFKANYNIVPAQGGNSQVYIYNYNKR